MSNFNFFQRAVMTAIFLITMFIFVPLGFADGRPMRVVKNSLYTEECGACHWPFLPGLLPESSWTKIMDGLKSHFGEDASLDAGSTASLREYITQNAANRSDGKISRKIMRSIPSVNKFVRVTEMPYIIRKHRELRGDVFKRPGVKSFSNCASCHPKAMEGDFEEDNVRIPGSIAFFNSSDKMKPVISLTLAISLAKAEYPGTFVKAEMEHGVYEVKLLTNEGSVRKVFVDPVNGKVLNNSYIDDDD